MHKFAAAIFADKAASKFLLKSSHELESGKAAVVVDLDDAGLSFFDARMKDLGGMVIAQEWVRRLVCCLKTGSREAMRLFNLEETLMTTYKVGYLIGSLATKSINRKLAKALTKLAPPSLEFTEISFKDLPLYSYDYDADFPPVARAFKDAVKAVDALLFVTPEYNRSIPGGLKNAIDWASRPYGTNSFTHKPSAVIGTSPGAIGTAVAQQSLRSVLSFCNSPQMNAPEAYIQFTPGLVTDEGEVTVGSTEEFLRSYMGDFHTFIARVLSVLPRDR